MKKYIAAKEKYLQMKLGLSGQTGGSKCTIDESDIILFGSGGSTSIIIITKEHKVYKIFTKFIFKSKYYKKEVNYLNKSIANEIKIQEIITNEIINENISSHFVKYLGVNDCNDAKSLFKRCPKTYKEFMGLEKKQQASLCTKYFQGHPMVNLSDEYKVLELEYCPVECADYIKNVSKLPEIEMERYLDIFFFQIIHAIMSVKKKYPYFSHGDLFMRNILGLHEKDNGNYYTYEYNSKTFNVPQKKFFPKINDFGYTNLDSNIHNEHLFKSDYKDVYNLILDVYDGGNMGGDSLSTLCKDNNYKMQFLKKYFSTFFNVSAIDEFKKKSPDEMKFNWHNILDDDFMQSVGIIHPDALLNGYFHGIFGRINSRV